jgi:hypothetical protein
MWSLAVEGMPGPAPLELGDHALPWIAETHMSTAIAAGPQSCRLGLIRCPRGVSDGVANGRERVRIPARVNP